MLLKHAFMPFAVVVVLVVAIVHLVDPKRDGAPSSPLPGQPAAASQASGSSAPAGGGPYTPTSWAHALLAKFGYPESADNVAAIVAWERAEGGHWHNTATYNPLNTTQEEPGSHAMNSVGVQAYTSWDQGLAATVTTLRNGRYEGILRALWIGTCAPCIAAAVSLSPWGTGWFSA